MLAEWNKVRGNDMKRTAKEWSELGVTMPEIA